MCDVTPQKTTKCKFCCCDITQRSNNSHILTKNLHTLVQIDCNYLGHLESPLNENCCLLIIEFPWYASSISKCLHQTWKRQVHFPTKVAAFWNHKAHHQSWNTNNEIIHSQCLYCSHKYAPETQFTNHSNDGKRHFSSISPKPVQPTSNPHNPPYFKYMLSNLKYTWLWSFHWKVLVCVAGQSLKVCKVYCLYPLIAKKWEQGNSSHYCFQYVAITITTVCINHLDHHIIRIIETLYQDSLPYFIFPLAHIH